MCKLLIVDDDDEVAEALARVAKLDGFEPQRAASVNEARAILRHESVDLVFLDLMLPDGTGLDLVDELRESEVIMVTGSPSIDSATLALRYRFRDYLTKPVDLAAIRQHLAAIKAEAAEGSKESSDAGAQTEEGQTAKSTGQPKSAKKTSDRSASDSTEGASTESPIVGKCAAMNSIDTQITRVAPTTAAVLIVGESGTGKEMTAQALHVRSDRRDQPFVPVNCGAIPETLIESELFGHVKGSFTGADRDHRGVFERADGGTLFLDEVTEMMAEMQVRLLRVLEESRVRRVGSEDEFTVDVRVVAATNRDPSEAVSEGKLREDLFYRLCVFQIKLPPLRERVGDVAELTHSLVAAFGADTGTTKVVTDDALAVLDRYSWPGNVRQLKNALYHAFILAEDEITAQHLPPLVEPEEDRGSTIGIPVTASIAEAEERLIDSALERFDGNKKLAAEALGISERTLYNRLKEYRARDED